MKKNISINISGIIFHIEEDGYETLRKYLDSVNKYFSSYEDSSEILADIESRIAEIFLSKLNEGKQVITAEDVTFLISTMGSVSDFKAAEEQEFPAGESAHSQSSYQSTSSSSANAASKKLYRDQKRKILGGVCAGLAHYFSIDPIWPRLLFALLVLGSYGSLLLVYIILWIALPASEDLEDEPSVKKMFRDTERKVLGGVASGVAAFFGAEVVLIRFLFVLLTFAGGLGFILYVILWIALPEAKTITEKMQMQGEPVTLSNIESTVKKGLNEKGEEESMLAKIVLFPFRLIAMILTGLAKVLGPLFRVSIDALRIMIGVFFTLLGITLMVSLIFTLGVVLGLFHAPDWLFLGNWNLEASNFPIEAFRNTFSTWTVIFAFLLAIIPSVFITLIGNSIIANRIVFNAYVGWALFVLFFVSVVILGVNVPRMVYAFREEGEYRVEQSFDLKGKTPYLKINEIGMDDYQVTDITLKGYDGKTLKLVQRFEAQGSSRKEAGENAQMISYNVTQTDSVISFDSNVTFLKDAKFRAQRLNMDLYIPYNQPFKVEEGLWRMIEVYRRHYRFHSENGDETWRLTEKELECISCSSENNETVSDSMRGGNSFNLRDFKSIELRGIFDAKIQQGEEFSVHTYPTDENNRHYKLYVDGETLMVEYDNDNDSFWRYTFPRDAKIRISITMPSLHDLDVKGAGEVNIRGFDEDDLKLKLVGAVTAKAELSARNLDVALTGASTLDLRGEGDFLEADIVGASGLRAYGYEVDRALVEAHGASSAKVNVSETLEITKGAASTVSHRGSPQVIDRN